MKTFLLLALVTLVLIAAGFIGVRSMQGDTGITKPAVEPSMASVTIPVKGMSCMACVAKTKRKLSAVPGISHVEVQLSPGSATVKYDESQIGPEKIAIAITELGYQAEAPVPEITK